MSRKRTPEFREEAARVALSSNQPRKVVAADFGVSVGSLNRWVSQYREREGSSPNDDAQKELARLRREVRELREERAREADGTAHSKKGGSLLCEPKAVKFQFVHLQRENHSIAGLCRAMSVSESGFFAWRNRPTSKRQREDMVLLAHIKSIHYANYQSYGRGRMKDELQEEGICVGEHRVARIMKQNNLRIVRSQKFKRTTDSDHKHNISPNLLDGDFAATAPDQKWAGDITYLWTGEGWLYLAVVIDLYSRRVIGWSASRRMKKDLVMDALNKAIALRKPPAGVIFHSDRGSQYCSNKFRKLLAKYKFEQSMSGKGNCYDNAAVETFFKTLKAEMVWKIAFQTRDHAKKELFKYINGFYNAKRRHSYLNGLSPIKFEKRAV
ncbi:IS3 family transposase [Terasakiella sp. SH-1]|uniref:IS3 family transposase n=1 Tax=Terasakiella sp. SH-1 TaxID=2560057 RepID=UPI0010737927|nr:IS3 family transposase [Terasakiella sp. SH-1]